MAVIFPVAPKQETKELVVSRISRLLFLPSLICLILSGTLAVADETDSDAESQRNRILAELITKYNLAYEANDFQAQTNIMRQLQDITGRDDSEKSPITAAEVRMALADLETALAMPQESFQIAREAQAEQRLGRAASLRGDYDGAIAHFDKSLELAKVYGDVSFSMLETKMLIAGVIENSGKDIPRGIRCGNEVKIELERRQLANSQLYRKTLTYLFVLQLASGELASGVENGEALIRLFQKKGLERTVQFAQTTGIVARSLNNMKQPLKAYRYAALGLKTCPALAGQDMKYGVRLLHEAAKAAVSLNDYEQVPMMYEQILSKIAVMPRYPDNLKLEFLEEYSAVLETIGDQMRNAEIKGEIEAIKNPPTLQKSRYSESQ